MIVNATGLVLRARPFTETSLIVNWLTPDCGRIATVAKGALRPKSPFRGKLDLFYLADFSFSRSRRSELHTLREVNLRDAHGWLRQDLDHLRQAVYCAALVEQATERETPLPAIFGLMQGFLNALPHSALQPQAIFAFELKLLDELGLKPDLAKSNRTPGARELVRVLIECDWRTVANLRLSAAQTSELRQFLHGFLIFHLGRLPPSRRRALGETPMHQGLCA